MDDINFVKKKLKQVVGLMQLLMLTLALIAAGRKVESRTARTQRRATRQGSQLNHPTSRPTTHFNKKKDGSIVLLIDARGDWAHLRSTRVSRQVRRVGGD